MEVMDHFDTYLVRTRVSSNAHIYAGDHMTPHVTGRL